MLTTAFDRSGPLSSEEQIITAAVQRRMARLHFNRTARKLSLPVANRMVNVCAW